MDGEARQGREFGKTGGSGGLRSAVAKERRHFFSPLSGGLRANQPPRYTRSQTALLVAPAEPPVAPTGRPALLLRRRPVYTARTPPAAVRGKEPAMVRTPAVLAPRTPAVVPQGRPRRTPAPTPRLSVVLVNYRQWPSTAALVRQLLAAEPARR